MAIYRVHLPLSDDHIPTDRQIPDGLGLPIRVQYEGDPIGKVTGWHDNGDGTAEATLDLNLELPDDIVFGLDAVVSGRPDLDPPTVERIVVLKGVGVRPRQSGDPR